MRCAVRGDTWSYGYAPGGSYDILSGCILALSFPVWIWVQEYVQQKNVCSWGLSNSPNAPIRVHLDVWSLMRELLACWVNEELQATVGIQ